MPNATGAWDWNYVSRNIDMEGLLRNMHLPWNITGLCMNEKIPIPFLVKMVEDMQESS